MLRRFSISRSISTRRRFRSAVVALTSLLANSCSTSERTIARLASRARWHPSATNPFRMSTVDNLTSSKTMICTSRPSKSGNERDEPGRTTRLRYTRLLRRVGLQHLIFCPHVKCTGSANTVESLGEKGLHIESSVLQFSKETGEVTLPNQLAICGKEKLTYWAGRPFIVTPHREADLRTL